MDSDRLRHPALSSHHRAALSIVIGLMLAFSYVSKPIRGYEAGDLGAVVRGARAMLAGRSPYEVVLAPEGNPLGDDRLYYPLPAAMLLAPLSAVPPVLLRALWSGFAVAVITWLLLGQFGVHALAVVFSRCATTAFGLAQWSPWFFAAALVAPLQVLLVAKPTLGFIVWAYRPSRWAVIGGVMLLALSFSVRPTWFGEWMEQASSSPYYIPAALVWRGGGPLLLLAALRWRRHDARLLLAMACVPHNFLWYDQLLLFLVPQTPRQLWSLFGLSWASAIAAGYFAAQDALTGVAAQESFRAPIVALLYLPCLAMVLRRPNARPATVG